MTQNMTCFKRIYSLTCTRATAFYFFPNYRMLGYVFISNLFPFLLSPCRSCAYCSPSSSKKKNTLTYTHIQIRTFIPISKALDLQYLRALGLTSFSISSNLPCFILSSKSFSFFSSWEPSGSCSSAVLKSRLLRLVRFH